MQNERELLKVKGCLTILELKNLFNSFPKEMDNIVIYTEYEASQVSMNRVSIVKNDYDKDEDVLLIY